MNTKYLMLLVCAVSAFALSSCKEEPLPIPVEEWYTRSFIKTFGLIDPKQDWNLAKASAVNINVGKLADEVKVYCKVDGKYYIVAVLNNVEGEINVPIDIPDDSDDIYVKIDGKGYHTTVDKNLNLSDTKSRGTVSDAFGPYDGYTVTASDSESTSLDAQQTLLTDNGPVGNYEEQISGNQYYNDPEDPTIPGDDTPVSWIIAAEDLGTVDDFDFNDVVFKLTSVTSNFEGVITKRVTVKALAAGGTLPVFLHYVDKNGDDYVLGPGIIKLASKKTDADEWHKWFGRGYRTSTMINTEGGTTVTSTAEVTFSTDFDVETYSVKNPTDGKIKGFYLEVNGYYSLGTLGGAISKSDTDKRTITIGGAETGMTPQMFLIRDNGWRWPKERERIFKAYPNFKKWVNSVENVEWVSSSNMNLTCRPIQ